MLVLPTKADPIPEEIRKKTMADCESGLVFDWSFHVACNYRCPYCYFEGHWGDLAKLNRMMPLEVVIANWKRIYDKHGQCYIVFNGGEPTVYPRFQELMRELSQWHRWNFNTNLSWDIPRWRRFADEVDVSMGSVQFSYHPTQEPDFRTFLEKAAFMKSLGFRNYSVCIVTYPPHLPNFRRYCLELKLLGIHARLQPFVGVFEGRKYPEAHTREERELINGLSRECDSMLLLEMDYAIGDSSPLGKPCRSGQLYYHINQLGDVYRCTRVPQTPETRLGNFYDGFELLDEPRPCPMKFCGCGESRWLVENCG